jgi:antirestriction protein ArdC
MANQEAIRKRVTEEIVAALKSGTRLPWSRPWSDLENTGLPTNAVSANPYRGINVLLLMLVSQARGYTSKYWATFNQWRDLGFQVQRRPDHIPAGQYGTRCILYKPVTKTTKNDDGDDEEHRYFLLREFVLFSAEAVCGPGSEDYLAKPRSSSSFVDYQPAEEVIAATGADIRHGGNKAVYRIEQDYIQMPVKGAFLKTHEYYGTALHELCHWSGHDSRLNRLVKLARFGSESYAIEELIAELGSAFLCAELGIPNSDDRSNVTAYLSSWLDVLQRDHNAIFTAASAASKAADFILGFSRPQEETETTEQPEAVGAH